MCASIWVFSLNFEELSPWPFFLRDNFNSSAGLAQSRGLAQTLYKWNMELHNMDKAQSAGFMQHLHY